MVRTLDLRFSVVVRTFFSVSRPRPRPGQNELECTRVETMVSRSQHWLHQFLILVTEHSLKGGTNYGNCAIGVGTKDAVLRPRPRPGSSGLETKTWTK